MSLKLIFLLVALTVGNFAQDTKISSRIIGGEPSDHVPYMVALTIGYNIRKLLCGGTLATTRHVLTAAHCFNAITIAGYPVDSLRGHVGTRRYASGGTTYTFIGGTQHPHFNFTALKNDIAVLLTSSVVKLSDSVSLTTLTYRYVEAGEKTTMTGWGKTSEEKGSHSPVLLKLDTVIVDGNECVTRVAERREELSMNKTYVDPVSEICAYSYKDERTGSCTGDPGSPLVLRDTNEQIGLMSWGLECAHGVPDMFARFSYYQDWIESTIQSITEP